MSKINIVVAAQTNSAIKGLNQVTQATKRTGDSVRKAQKNLKTFGTETSRTTMMTRKFAMGGLQQAGYQIGDYAVQVANGTSKMQAFGQQAPQLLQIFGPIGAVVGAGVAIFAAFGVALQKSGQEASNLASTLGVLQEPLSKIGSAISSIKDSFGGALPVIINNIDTAIIAAGLFASVVGLKMVVSMVRAAGAGKLLAASMATVRAAVLASALSAGKFSGVMVALRSATLLLGGALKAVGAILMRFLPIAIFVGFAKLIEMFLTLRKGAGGFGNAIKLLKDVVQEQFQRIALRGERMYLRLKLGINGFKMGFINALIPMAEKFDQFASMLTEKWNNMFPEGSVLDSFRINSGDGIAAGIKEDLKGVQDAAQGMRNEIIQIDSDLGQPLTAWQALKAAMAAANEETSIFSQNTEESADGSSKWAGTVDGELSPALKRLKQVQQSVSSSIENGLMSIVDGSKSVKDAFKSMASEVIKELYRIFVVKKITGFISDAIGGFGGSAPTTSLRPVARPSSFSGGGYTGNGARAGGMDGKGGFMAMLHPRETIVDHTKGQGAGGVTVIQNNTFQSGVTRSEVNALLPKMVEASKAAVIDAKRQGGSYGKAFA